MHTCVITRSQTYVGGKHHPRYQILSTGVATDQPDEAIQLNVAKLLMESDADLHSKHKDEALIPRLTFVSTHVGHLRLVHSGLIYDD